MHTQPCSFAMCAEAVCAHGALSRPAPLFTERLRVHTMRAHCRIVQQLWGTDLMHSRKQCWIPLSPRTSQSHEMTGECPGIPKQQTRCYRLVPIGKATRFCMSGLPSSNFKISTAEYNSASPAPRTTNEYFVSCPGSLSGAGQIEMGDNVGINPVPWKSSWCIARPHFKTQRHTKS